MAYKELLTYNQSPERTAEMLNIESGQLLRSLIYMERFGLHGYAKNTRAETGDAITMLFLFCEQMGWNLDEIKAEGLERFQERMQQIKEGKQ